MTDFRTTVQQLQRPRMLIHAARMGLCDYRRERDLRRLGHISLQPEQALPDLLDHEGQAEQRRRAGDVTYSLTEHVELLIALMGELRLQPKQSAP